MCHKKYRQYRQEFLYAMDFITLLTRMKNIRQVMLRHLVRKDYNLAEFIDVSIKQQTTENYTRLNYKYKCVEFYPSI